LRSGGFGCGSRGAITDSVLGAAREHRPQRTGASRARHSEHPLPAIALQAEEPDGRPWSRLALHSANVTPAVAGRHLPQPLRVHAFGQQCLDRSKRSLPEGAGLAASLVGVVQLFPREGAVSSRFMNAWWFFRAFRGEGGRRAPTESFARLLGCWTGRYSEHRNISVGVRSPFGAEVGRQ